MGGERICFLTSANDVAAVCKNTSAFIFDRVVYELSIRFGVSLVATDKIHHKPSSEEDDIVGAKLGISNPQFKTLHHLNSEFFKEQLHPGEKYDLMLEKYTTAFEYLLRPGHFPSRASQIKNSDEDCVSLAQCTQDLFMEVSTRILFGDKLQRLDPDFIKIS